MLTDQTAASHSVGRLAMASRLAQLEWSAEIIAEGLPISPLRYPAEPGLPDAWGMLSLKWRLQKMGHRFEDLNVVDRLAPVCTKGQSALVFQPESFDGKASSTLASTPWPINSATFCSARKHSWRHCSLVWVAARAARGRQVMC